MVVDVDDVQYIVDNVAVELKKEANQTQQTVVDLRDIDKAIVDLNREIHPDQNCFKDHEPIEKVALMLQNDVSAVRQTLDDVGFRE